MGHDLLIFLILYNHLIIFKVTIIILSLWILSLKIAAVLHLLISLAFRYWCLLYISRMTSSCFSYTDPASSTLFDLLRCLQNWVTGELSIFGICMSALWYNDWCQPKLCQTSLITTSYIPFQTVGLVLSFWSTPLFTYLQYGFNDMTVIFLFLKCLCYDGQK